MLEADPNFLVISDIIRFEPQVSKSLEQLNPADHVRREVSGMCLLVAQFREQLGKDAIALYSGLASSKKAELDMVKGGSDAGQSWLASFAGKSTDWVGFQKHAAKTLLKRNGMADYAKVSELDKDWVVNY